MHTANKKPDRYTKINVRINDDERALVQDIQDRTGLTVSQIVRRAMRSYHLHEVVGAPHCANGNDCMCPNLHYRMPQPPLRQPGARTVPTDGAA